MRWLANKIAIAGAVTAAAGFAAIGAEVDVPSTPLLVAGGVLLVLAMLLAPGKKEGPR